MPISFNLWCLDNFCNNQKYQDHTLIAILRENLSDRPDVGQRLLFNDLYFFDDGGVLIVRDVVFYNEKLDTQSV